MILAMVLAINVQAASTHYKMTRVSTEFLASQVHLGISLTHLTSTLTRLAPSWRAANNYYPIHVVSQVSGLVIIAPKSVPELGSDSGVRRYTLVAHLPINPLWKYNCCVAKIDEYTEMRLKAALDRGVKFDQVFEFVRQVVLRSVQLGK